MDFSFEVAVQLFGESMGIRESAKGYMEENKSYIEQWKIVDSSVCARGRSLAPMAERWQIIPSEKKIKDQLIFWDECKKEEIREAAVEKKRVVDQEATHQKELLNTGEQTNLL